MIKRSRPVLGDQDFDTGCERLHWRVLDDYPLYYISRLYTEVEVYMGILNTEGEARSVQIPIYTNNKVYNRFKLCF